MILISEYDQGRNIANVSPPSPLSALCSANEVAVVIEAGPEAESFVNANGSDRTKSSGAVECFRTWRSTARFGYARCGPDDFT